MGHYYRCMARVGPQEHRKTNKATTMPRLPDSELTFPTGGSGKVKPPYVSLQASNSNFTLGPEGYGQRNRGAQVTRQERAACWCRCYSRHLHQYVTKGYARHNPTLQTHGSRGQVRYAFTSCNLVIRCFLQDAQNNQLQPQPPLATIGS